jgi:hypothetical protein
MLPEYDNAVRLMDSEESLQDLCAKFLFTDEEGSPWLDFAKVVMAEHEESEAVIRRRLSHTPEAVSQEDLEFLRKLEQLKKNIDCEDNYAWAKANYGARSFSFDSPQLMWFFNSGYIMSWQVHRLAILIKRPLRFSWMDLQLTRCGWLYCNPNGESTGNSYDFESGLAPEWLWSDQGCGDSNWAREWVNMMCGRERDAKPN